ncbi:MAG: alanine--tRNA ligase-related protein [Clostridia bacterium]|nr:alanine--tRNA ligase-related protein [Clostridia bacterium]
MATEKLFYQDSHLQTFDAQVVSCEPSKHGYDVILDRTAFYPEGGGQPGDTGMLGDVRVTDTHELGGEVVHYCEKALQPGSTVHGAIDWDRRFSFMQLHSGEHIFSGIGNRRVGYHNGGFQMGADFVTIDFNGVLTENQIREIEQEANEFVWKNLPILVTYPDAERLKTIPYRSKKELSGWVRIVTIPDADICACCGTHVSNTGEIGLIKTFSCVRFHEGVRIEMLCGRKALAYLSAVAEQNRINSGLLSAKPLETSLGVQRTLDELGKYKLRVSQLEMQSFAAKAEAYKGAGRSLLFEEGLDPDGVRKLTDAVMSACGDMAAVFSGSNEAGYKYAVGQENGDLREFVKRMNAQLSGRGGGKPFFAQGSVQATRREIEAFFAGEWKE